MEGETCCIIPPRWNMIVLKVNSPSHGSVPLFTLVYQNINSAESRSISGGQTPCSFHIYSGCISCALLYTVRSHMSQHFGKRLGSLGLTSLESWFHQDSRVTVSRILKNSLNNDRSSTGKKWALENNTYFHSSVECPKKLALEY
jgi:hypothetical protein